MNKTQAIAKIARIDRAIDAVMAELCGVEKVREFSSASWQKAWDKHPDLYARFKNLNRQRGAAQLVRDELAEKERRAKERAARRQYRKASGPFVASDEWLHDIWCGLLNDPKVPAHNIVYAFARRAIARANYATT